MDKVEDNDGSDKDSCSESVSEEGHPNVTEPVVLTPLQAAILEKEKSLAAEIENLENRLLLERQMLFNLESKISEGGKNAYYMVQAQVNDFKVEFSSSRLVKAYPAIRCLHVILLINCLNILVSCFSSCRDDKQRSRSSESSPTSVSLWSECFRSWMRFEMLAI